MRKDRLLQTGLAACQYFWAFLKWALTAVCTGALCGLLGTWFHHAIDLATGFRQAHGYIIWLLPAAGLLTLLLYRLCRVNFCTGTNLIITSVSTNEHIPVLLAPLIMAGTVLSHLFGASVGREGAALQLGGSVGHNLGELLRFDKDDVQVLSMCGMAACFSSMFGTPMAAAMFVLEVVAVGTLRYGAFLPCVTASFSAFWVSSRLGSKPMGYTIPNGAPDFRVLPALQVAALAALCALLGMLMCKTLHAASHRAEKLIPNAYLRIAAGGLVMAAVVGVFGLYDYAGAGAHMIERAVNGEAAPWAFLLKLALTALCVGAGYRGGEIVPTLFIGATFGCAAGPLLGLEPGFAAAVGMTALFCAVVNCPIASIFLAAELFSSTSFGLYAIAAAVAFVLSGYSGLYSSQSIVFSKVKHGLRDGAEHLWESLSSSPPKL